MIGLFLCSSFEFTLDLHINVKHPDSGGPATFFIVYSMLFGVYPQQLAQCGPKDSHGRYINYLWQILELTTDFVKVQANQVEAYVAAFNNA
jgi:hypothetical protein